ncbi:DDHD domain-containing protein [Bimuria novae-zelandiae CBS 107.79]|uniref:DDHD domain-containing protein n=1 Tax=Bimuria novae-zelandiae CBS 107.79 TaxID=1447943 RepID=A0A6A5UZY6_9PLEO|nr:DDHD domain-containing protein [Bimuria novae-zelandiae CBS 107.79]
MSVHVTHYIREVLHTAEAPPAIPVRYFYTSPLAIDDPLSPLPPPTTGSSTASKHPPRPFSEYDNEAINETWLVLRKKILKHNEELGEKRRSVEGPATPTTETPTYPAVKRLKRRRGESATEEERLGASRGKDIPPTTTRSWSMGGVSRSLDVGENSSGGSSGGAQAATLTGSMRALALDPTEGSPRSEAATTGMPFTRLPSRGNNPGTPTTGSVEAHRPAAPQLMDSYKWDDDMESALPDIKDKGPTRSPCKHTGPSAKVPVGVSRLHHVAMDAESIRMEPIYWAPVNDVSQVIRGTWFYKDTMMPVEVEVANMLEVGYLEMKPWTETWKDELNSAVEVGALGEMKILHKLWPDIVRQVESRPSTSNQMLSTTGLTQSNLPEEPLDAEKEYRTIVEHACDMIDISTGPEGPDNKAAGDCEYGHGGRKNRYRTAGVLYATDKEAYILRPNLQPSHYYGRRPLANYIRKGRPIGIQVVRGFDQAVWDKLHPPKKSAAAQMAHYGVSSSQAGAPPFQRQRSDPALALSDRPQVTDLVLVIHGIGQKLSERMETFHFTHAINAFRREVNVELGDSDVKRNLRKNMGGIMVLPVNWRLQISLESEATGSTEGDEPAINKYTLKDITPDTLPSVRGIVSDVMLDIPYYLSQEHHPKMVAACIQEANRIYRLWCQNNPGFSEWGRVHIIAHSLGSVMAMDILSDQPTVVNPRFADPACPEADIPKDHFIFNTSNLFVCGSPVGFFLLLRNATLLPRRDKEKPDADSYATPGVAGDQGMYGCIAVDNIYNVINGYDPVAYTLNAAVDVSYAATLKPAIIPSASSSLFSFANPFRSKPTHHSRPDRHPTERLPSNVELETHNFTREEIAEKRAYLLNDNGQVDFYLHYGGGVSQYITMLGAHSSYWIHRDFVRFVVMETGRREGRQGRKGELRAQKKRVRGAG